MNKTIFKNILIFSLTPAVFVLTIGKIYWIYRQKDAKKIFRNIDDLILKLKIQDNNIGEILYDIEGLYASHRLQH